MVYTSEPLLMNKKSYKYLSITFDFVASAVAWSLFYLYRKEFIESVKYGVPVSPHFDLKFFASLVFIPLGWFILYYAGDMYEDIRRKDRKQDLFHLLLINILGCIAVFFLLLLDDVIISYRNYYNSLLVLLSLQTILVFAGRAVILSIRDNAFKTGKDDFRTLIAGDSSRIKAFLRENENWLSRKWVRIEALIITDKPSQNNTDVIFPVYAPEELEETIRKYAIEEVFILLGAADSKLCESLQLRLNRCDVRVSISPELYHLADRPVRFNSILDSPVLELSGSLLSRWQGFLKTLTDIVISLAALLLLSPLVIVLAIIIKLSSSGPVLYCHERIGKNGKPFNIYKFRSMYNNAEENGPQLAAKNDSRITPVGRFMRKRRLDEIPNFINVLAGQMSLVGPRPERAYYINQIMTQAPQYSRLHLVKPGITSWGQVKYGYAENIREMIVRMRYDLVYIENMSLYVDFQILLHTVGTVLKGKGL